MSRVSIIQRTPASTDYCVNGRRVTVLSGAALPRDVFIYELERYAGYIFWRVRNKARFPNMLNTPLVAFEYMEAK